MNLKDFRSRTDDELKGLRSMYEDVAGDHVKELASIRNDIGRITQVLNERATAKARRVQKMRAKR